MKLIRQCRLIRYSASRKYTYPHYILGKRDYENLFDLVHLRNKGKIVFNLKAHEIQCIIVKLVLILPLRHDS